MDTTFQKQLAIQAKCFHPSGEWEAFPPAGVSSSLVTRFEAMAARYPERPAIKMADLCLTYAVLNQQANQVAHAVLAQMTDHNSPVLLLFGHTPTAGAAIFGVLKAGHFYTPFDPTQPAARLIERVVDSGARLLLTDQQHLALAREINATNVIILVIDALPVVAALHNPGLSITADAPALLLYTSGSTGRPKGILLSHRALLHRIKRQTEIIHLSCEDRCACVHTYDAIAGLRDLFCPLLNGAMTCLFDLKRHPLAELPAWLQAEGITILGFVTPIFRHLLNLLPPDAVFPRVRMICIGGDTLYRQDVERYRQAFPPTAILYNSLGATETAGGFCYYLFDHHSPLPPDPLPVGYPMIDMTITIVDQAAQPLVSNEPGEIVLSTPYLAQGYWQQPDQTAARFRTTGSSPSYLTGDIGFLRPDGCLIHQGRHDHQVKIRGYRVEIGEVERTLLRHPAVQEVAVVLLARDQADAQLVAYWVAQPTLVATQAELAAWLNTTLPTYMIPSAFVMLESLPLSPNGKVDRRTLPIPAFNSGHDRAVAVAPRTPTEQVLAQLWCELLQVAQIGIHDNFFQAGGHSVLVVRMLAQVEQQFRRPLVLRDFVFNPTIAHLATLLDNAQAGALAVALSETQPIGSENEPLRLLYDALADKGKFAQMQKALQPKRTIPRLLQVLLRLPQPIALQLLAWAVQQPWVQRRYLPRQTALVQQFLDGVEGLTQPKQSLARCLFFGFLNHFGLRGALFRRLRTEGRTIPVAGLALLTHARTQGRPVILLNSHTYQASYFRSLELVQGGVGSMEELIRETNLAPVTARHILYARQLELACQTLQQGGAISLAPDVNRGYGPHIAVGFHGRMHTFRTSFAELALLTGAQIFFVASDLKAYNRFSFRLVGPFDQGSATMSHTEQVQHLMNQYIKQLRQQWAKNPWALPWWLMSEHLACPPVFA